MSGLEVLGTAASVLQILGLLYNLTARIFKKPKDVKALTAIRSDAQQYAVRLRQWESQLTAGPQDACRNLREMLEDVVKDLEALGTRNTREKVLTALKLYQPEYQKRFGDLIEEFKFRMCAEGQISATKMRDQLNYITEKMEELRITSKTLQNRLGTEAIIASLQQEIEDLSKSIQAIRAGIDDIHRTIKTLEQWSIPAIEKTLKSDGDNTRQTIEESTSTLRHHMIKLNERLDMNDSRTRIINELIPNPKSVIWYDDALDRQEISRIWHLDIANAEQPYARYNGMELSSIRLESIKHTMSKRDIAEEVDDIVRERKRRRVGDISPYLGLVKRDGHFVMLNEYIPSTFKTNFANEIDHEAQLRALQLSQTLSQEYRYAILDRICKQKVLSLPKLRHFEELERAMLALQAGKFNVELGFYIRRPFGEGQHRSDFLFNFQVKISRLGYDISAGDYPHNRDFSELERMWYDMEKTTLVQIARQCFYSAGREGLSEVVRACLQIYNYRTTPEPRMQGHERIRNIMKELFPTTIWEKPIYRDPYYLCSPAMQEVLDFTGQQAIHSMTRDGALFWHRCELFSPSSKMQFEGFRLFEDYWLSEAMSKIAVGDYSEAKILLEQGLNCEESASPISFNWKLLEFVYQREGSHSRAVEVSKMAELVGQAFADVTEDTMSALYQRVMKVGLHNSDLCLRVAYLCKHLHARQFFRFPEALNLLEKCIEYNPDEWHLYWMMARIYCDMDNHQMGRQTLLRRRDNEVSQCSSHDSRLCIKGLPGIFYNCPCDFDIEMQSESSSDSDFKSSTSGSDDSEQSEDESLDIFDFNDSENE